MDVTIDKENLAADFSHLGNLEEVLAEIHEHYIPEGQQLFQVHVNGEFFSERYPRESRYLSLKEVARLDLKTLTDVDMARFLLRDAIRQAETLVLAIGKCATLFRVAAEEEANHHLSEVLEALRWLLRTGEEAHQVLQGGEKGKNSSLYQGSPYLKILEKTLKEMEEILEEEDYVMLADLMEYELLPLVQEWQKTQAEIVSH